MWDFLWKLSTLPTPLNMAKRFNYRVPILYRSFLNSGGPDAWFLWTMKRFHYGWIYCYSKEHYLERKSR